ncbi:hypothetical protein M413DRAFT_187421 [Hebeloma cylindrosporum]|uniref:Uncharacterized protein n=1 Tax=Hebeloma cylindrosporum TaxID=76867 RepID=A0A0C3C8I5_HEBCY|nr:hypothetical protein M413DRAFT_187421 [Hebeloma cylindrosporum h7]
MSRYIDSYEYHRARNVRIGIVLFRQNNPNSPLWAFAFHHESYNADQVCIRGIYSVQNGAEWTLRDSETENYSIRNDPRVLGVIHVVDLAKWSPFMFDLYLSRFSPKKDGEDPSKGALWSHSSWVIRALAHLEYEDFCKFPCLPQYFLPFVREERIPVLRDVKRKNGKVPVIKLDPSS